MSIAWENVPLWSVVREVRSVVQPASLGAEVIHYSIPSVDETGTGKRQSADEIQSAKLYLNGDEVLVSRLNPRKSRVVMVQPSKTPIVASTEFIALRPANIDRRFLAYLLTSETIRQCLDSNVQSVTRSHQRVDPGEITHLTIRLPALAEQRRIADFLDAETSRIDVLISKRSRQRELERERYGVALDQLLCARADQLERPLSYLVDSSRPIQYGIILPGPHFPNGVPIIKGGDIGAARLTPEQLKCTDPAIDARYSRSRVREGDIVISIRGSVGDVARIPANLTGANLTQDSARIAPSGADGTWLYYILQAHTVQHRISSLVTGATIRGINIYDLRRIRIPVPELGVQQRLGRLACEQANRLHSLGSAFEGSIGLLSERRRTLITTAVTGQLAVPPVDGALVS